MTDTASVEAYLHEHIPISAAMGITVTAAGLERVTLTAPLGPNVNHRSTVFGGSCASVAILAAWTLAHLRVTTAGEAARVVIQHGATDYRLPIGGTFAATCLAPDEAVWLRFLHTLRRRGRARVELTAEVTSGNLVVASFSGTYVAISGQGEELLEEP